MHDIPDEIWAWIRRELPDEGFRTWLWRAPEETLRSVLGSAYENVLSADSVDARALSVVKDELVASLPRACACPLLVTKQWLGIWAKTTPAMIGRSFESVRKRNPWLSLLRCRTCGEFWYVAYDTVDDGWYFERVTKDRARAIGEDDDWPDTFDEFENVWPNDGADRSKEPPAGFLAGVAMTLLD